MITGRFHLVAVTINKTKKGADSESFSPKFGVLYHPSEQATIYYSYTEGFEPQRSETLNDED